MPLPASRLVLVYEPEEACLRRLVGNGFAERHASEIASYLAQSTDLSLEFEEIGAECRRHGVFFEAVELDDAAAALGALSGTDALVWPLTDGIAYFRGSAAPTLARLNGLEIFGAEDSLFALCQDKFRSGAVLSAMGIPVPAAGLARGGSWLVEPPPSGAGYFVKPNRLGAKIGIWPDSHCASLEEALTLSRRIHAAYRDDAIVQSYVTGRNVRASFLAVEAAAGVETLDAFFVQAPGDFQTMADSMALYGETGAVARDAGRYSEPQLIQVAAEQPAADRRIRAIAARLSDALGLRDVYSLDFRVAADGTVHLLEFEVCPGLPCFDFRAYCRNAFDLSLPQAMALAAANRFERR